MVDYEGDLPDEIVQLGEDSYTIQGKMAGSSWEVMYAIALSNANWQYEYLAAWWIIGKPLEIDFRIFTVPKVSFVFIDGGVWHAGEEAQNDKIERLRLYDVTKTFANEPITVTNPDCQTYDACWAHVLKTFGKR